MAATEEKDLLSAIVDIGGVIQAWFKANRMLMTFPPRSLHVLILILTVGVVDSSSAAWFRRNIKEYNNIK
jgi:hypothetical protein